MPRSPRAHRERIRTEALLVRVAPFGEADVMATLLTEQRGVIQAVARSARRSIHRFPALEPMHVLRVGLEERSGGDVASLVESAIERPRLALVSSLARLEAAGLALRWVRRAASPNTREPVIWAEVNTLLDALETADDDEVGALVAGAGLRLLSAVGWGLDLARCVRCGRECGPGASAFVDPAEGGLVCRDCGGGPLLLRGERRARLLAVTLDERVTLRAEDARDALELVEATLAAHTAR